MDFITFSCFLSQNQCIFCILKGKTHQFLFTTNLNLLCLFSFFVLLIIIYKIRMVAIFHCCISTVQYFFFSFQLLLLSLSSGPVKSLFYFLTIWMTSSCSMMCVSPTLCGLYLVLVPQRTKGQHSSDPEQRQCVSKVITTQKDRMN